MMNSRKKWLPLMLAMSLVLSCGTVLAEPGTYSPEGYPEIVLNDYRDTTITIFLDMISDFNPEAEYAQKMREYAGVNVEWILVPRESFQENLTLLLASGDYPDLIGGLSEQQFLQGAEAGAWTELSAFLPEMPDLVEATYAEAMDRCYFDGGLYGVPRCGAIYSLTYMVRKDWVDKLGLALPVTLDDYYEFMKALALNDPDGNGRDDTYALSPSKGFAFDQFGQYALLMQAFGVGYGFQEDGNGNLVDTNMVPEAKAFFAYMRRLMEENIIDPAWATNATYQEQFYNGLAALCRSWQGSWTIASAKAQQVNPDAEIIYIDPPLGVDGQILSRCNMPSPQNWNAIPSSSENVDAVVQFLNACFTQPIKDLVEHGVEGVEYNVVDGEYVYTEKYEEYKSVRTWLQPVRDANYPGYFIAADLDAETRAYETDWYENKMVPRAIYDKSLGLETETSIRLKEEGWPAKIEEVVMKIIYGELPFEAWDELCEEYYAAGFGDYVEEVNSWYREKNP